MQKPHTYILNIDKDLEYISSYIYISVKSNSVIANCFIEIIYLVPSKSMQKIKNCLGQPPGYWFIVKYTRYKNETLS